MGQNVFGTCSWERFLESKNEILDPQDKISRLPESALHHIVSFLPTQDKDEIRFLSRKFRRINAQNQKTIFLIGLRLDEQEIPRILADDFPSVESLSLRNCLGMKTLKLMNHMKLKSIEVSYCGSLKNLHLNTPDLEKFLFSGPRVRPCTIELGICKQLKIMHLVGVAMNTAMFVDCNEMFPALVDLILSCCDMTGTINIKSDSLKMLSLLRFNESVDIIVDAQNLLTFAYNGSIIPFTNMKFPNLAKARIDLITLGRYQKGDEIWFRNLVEMVKSLKHTERLVLHTTYDKNIIVPKELRDTLVPPLDVIMQGIDIKARHITNYYVDLVDSLLWMCPRVKCITFNAKSTNFNAEYWFLIQLVHGELSVNSCGFCSSHPIRCWRHSLTHYQFIGAMPEPKNRLVSYLKENLKNVGRKAIDKSQ